MPTAMITFHNREDLNGMRFDDYETLSAWDFSWPDHGDGPWPLSIEGIEAGLGENRQAIGVYWIGYSPCGDHASFVAKYCGKAVKQSLRRRLFLDRVGRQQSPSPLRRHAQINMHSSNLRAKDDISTLPGTRHYYFALTKRVLELVALDYGVYT